MKLAARQGARPRQ